MLRKIRILAALLVCAALGQALSAQYTVGTLTNDFFNIDPTLAGDHVQYTRTNFTADDDGWLQVSLPFSFPFFGSNYNSVYISTNGFLSFTNSNLGAEPGVGQANPDAGAGLPNNAIYAAWCAGTATSTPVDSIVNIGTVATGEFAIQGLIFEEKTNNDNFNWTVVLHSNGVIEIHPRQGTGTFGEFYIGIENSTGSTGFNKPGGFATGGGLDNNTAYAFYPPGTEPSGGGGGDGGDEGCSTGTGTTGWLILAGLLSALAVGFRETQRRLARVRN